jgi:hypothetical protein
MTDNIILFPISRKASPWLEPEQSTASDEVAGCPHKKEADVSKTWISLVHLHTGILAWEISLSGEYLNPRFIPYKEKKQARES